MNQVVKKIMEMKQENVGKVDIDKIENKTPTSSVNKPQSRTTFFKSEKPKEMDDKTTKIDRSSPGKKYDKNIKYKNEKIEEDKFNEETASSITNWDEESISIAGNDMDDKVTSASVDCVAVDVVDGKSTNQKTHQNTYVAKKTAAQGLMDIALLTANANQLRYLIEYSSLTTTYYINIFLISLSLILQIAVGISLIFKGRYYYRGQSKRKRAKRLNNFVLVGVFLITIVNVFVASFTTITPLNQLTVESTNNKL